MSESILSAFCGCHYSNYFCIIYNMNDIKGVSRCGAPIKHRELLEKFQWRVVFLG